jgi:hypothetical protein
VFRPSFGQGYTDAELADIAKDVPQRLGGKDGAITVVRRQGSVTLRGPALRRLGFVAAGPGCG